MPRHSSSRLSRNAAELGRKALAAIEALPGLAETGCGRLPEAAARSFETQWADYLFGAFQEERTSEDPVFKMFLEPAPG